MCGLAGFFSPESIYADPRETLLKMGASLRHRGPDDSGTGSTRIMVWGLLISDYR